MIFINLLAIAYIITIGRASESYASQTTTIAIKIDNLNQFQLQLVQSNKVWGTNLCSVQCLASPICDVFTIIKNEDINENKCNEKYICEMRQIINEFQSSTERDGITNGTSYMFQNSRDAVAMDTDNLDKTANVKCNVSAVFNHHNNPAVFCYENFEIYVLDSNNLKNIKHTYKHISELFPDYKGSTVEIAFNQRPDIVFIQNGQWHSYKYTNSLYVKYDSELPSHTSFKTATYFNNNEHILISDTDSQCVSHDNKDSEEDNNGSEEDNNGSEEDNNGSEEESSSKKNKDSKNKKKHENNGKKNKNKKDKKSKGKNSQSNETTDSNNVTTECQNIKDHLKQLQATAIERIGNKYYIFKGSKGEILTF